MYPEPTNIWESLEYSSLGIKIAESPWMFPALEVIHVIALVSVIGTIAIVDLRLIGATSSGYAVSKLSKDTLPWTWGAFVLAAITGSMLFVSKASTYMVNPYFLVKMGLLMLAALNMLYFHFFTYRTIAQWDSDAPVPGAAKMAGWLSLVFWVGIVFCGRAIGFTLGIYY